MIEKDEHSLQVIMRSYLRSPSCLCSIDNYIVRKLGHPNFARMDDNVTIVIVIVQYNTNQIYNARKVTPKCESEARIVSHQVNSN